ncbi:hypothetical protein [Chloroflexus sp.]|uniref:hypothetical protein n=1 Tax=Chloroflexus sp. TaxID=1904827 RepID=UPI002ACDD2D5|nr:hypothetical protein [Chloroflexus sp.]
MEPSHPLHQLADQIERAGLSAPVAMVLQIVAPFDVVCSQGAQALAPFARGTRWASAIEALAMPEHWPELRDLLWARLRAQR